MRRPYLRYSPAWVDDDGDRVRAAVMITADPPGPWRHWSNLSDFRRSVSRVWRELREVRS